MFGLFCPLAYYIHYTMRLSAVLSNEYDEYMYVCICPLKEVWLYLTSGSSTTPQ